jgi:DMSO/TMAO reductase YedYZ heme-binding membrane subunit
MDPKLWWYLSRATGLVAWGLAVASILWGLALASRALGPRPKAPWLLALHRWLGGLTMLFVAAHVGAIVADSYVHFGAADVLVPFAAGWRTTAVAWGVIAAWFLVAIEITSFQMKRLPKRVWHSIHMTSYLVAVLATVHGVTAGADTKEPAFAWAMIGAMAATAFFAVYRRLAPKKTARSRVPRPTSPRDPRRSSELTGTAR